MATLTTINSSTVSVDDINIELGSTDNPTDATAEGGGITVKGTTDKTFNWHANGGWTSSENLSVADGKHFAGDELRALDAGGLSLFDNNQSGITIKGGKVGVHQADPVYDLDVDGSGNFTSLYVGGNSVLTGEGSVFGKWEDGATAGEIFYTGGNVGVGTINPEHKFHVVGDGVIDGNFIVNGTSGTFNVGEFDVSGSNITLNSAGGGLDSSRGGLIVNAETNKTFQYVGWSLILGNLVRACKLSLINICKQIKCVQLILEDCICKMMAKMVFSYKTVEMLILTSSLILPD